MLQHRTDTPAESYSTNKALLPGVLCNAPSNTAVRYRDLEPVELVLRKLPELSMITVLFMYLNETPIAVGFSFSFSEAGCVCVPRVDQSAPITLHWKVL